MRAGEHARGAGRLGDEEEPREEFIAQRIRIYAEMMSSIYIAALDGPALRQDWQTVLAYTFKLPAHINILEAEVVLTCLRHVIKGGVHSCRLLVLIDSGVVKGAGTNIIVALTPVRSTASATVSNTGTPATSCPPLPGVQPATTCVP